MASINNSQYSLNNSTRYVRNKNDRWQQLDRRMQQTQFLQRHEIPILGSFRDREESERVAVLRSMEKEERQRMPPMERGRPAVGQQRSQRRHACGHVTETLYSTIGAGFHSLMDSVASKLAYNPKPKFSGPTKNGELDESVDLTLDPTHGDKLDKIDAISADDQNQKQITVNNVTNYNVFNGQKQEHKSKPSFVGVFNNMKKSQNLRLKNQNVSGLTNSSSIQPISQPPLNKQDHLGKRDKAGSKALQQTKQKNVSSDDVSSSSSLESQKLQILKKTLNKQQKRQKVSVDFDLQEAFDTKKLESSMSQAMEGQMKRSMQKLEQQLAEKMGKQFAKMWEKAIDSFQEKLKEQSDLISQRSRSEHGRSRSPSEISRKSLPQFNGSRARSTSNGKGAAMPGNDFAGLGAKPQLETATRSKSPARDAGLAAFDLSNKNPAAKKTAPSGLFGSSTAAKKPEPAPEAAGLNDHPGDNATMRSKSTISNKSHLDSKAKKESPPGNAGASLFAAAPKGGLFGPNPSDMMRESPAFGKIDKSGEDKKITNKPAEEGQPGLFKPKASVAENETFKQPLMKKSKNENEGGEKPKAPSGGLFGQPSAAGSGLFSSSAEPKKPEGSLSFLSTAKKPDGSASSLFGGGSQTKATEPKTAADSGASSSAKNPYLQNTKVSNNPFLQGASTAKQNPFLSGSGNSSDAGSKNKSSTLTGGGLTWGGAPALAEAKPAPADAKKQPLFGGAGASSQPSGQSLFGGASQAAPSGSGLFGGGGAPAQPSTSGLFGGGQSASASSAKADPPAPAPSGSVFGNAPANGSAQPSLFGGAPAQSAPAGALFGQGPPSAPAKSLFAQGGQGQGQAAPAQGAGLFGGSKPAFTPPSGGAGGLFGGGQASLAPSAGFGNGPAAKPAPSAGFGGGGAFGGNPSGGPPQASPFGGAPSAGFGAPPQPTQGSLFGGNNSAGQGGSLFSSGPSAGFGMGTQNHNKGKLSTTSLFAGAGQKPPKQTSEDSDGLFAR